MVLHTLTLSDHHHHLVLVFSRRLGGQKRKSKNCTPSSPFSTRYREEKNFILSMRGPQRKIYYSITHFFQPNKENQLPSIPFPSLPFPSTLNHSNQTHLNSLKFWIVLELWKHGDQLPWDCESNRFFPATSKFRLSYKPIFVQYFTLNFYIIWTS